MKINKAKIAVAALAIATGVATAGSISGAYAWFQYNTRVNAAIVGTTANVGKNLQIRIHDDNIEAYDSTHSTWKTRLEVADVQGYLDAKYAITGTGAATKKMGNGKTFSPITFGALAKNAALSDGSAGGAKANPTSHRFDYSQWGAAIDTDYIILPLEVKLVSGSVSSSGTVAVSGESVYVTDLTIQKDSAAAEDMSSALRVHLAGNDGTTTVNQLWSNAASSDAATSAYLDMDNNGNPDMVRTSTYIWSSQELKTGVYGDGSTSDGVKLIDASKKVESYKVGSKNTATCPMADDTADKLVTTNAIALGTTNASGILGITATIWFEGFAALESKQVWDYKFVGQTFNVGMSFAVDAYR